MFALQVTLDSGTMLRAVFSVDSLHQNLQRCTGKISDTRFSKGKLSLPLCPLMQNSLNPVLLLGEATVRHHIASESSVGNGAAESQSRKMKTCSSNPTGD